MSSTWIRNASVGKIALGLAFIIRSIGGMFAENKQDAPVSVKTFTLYGRQRCGTHRGTNCGAPKGNNNAWKHVANFEEAEAAARYLKEIAKSLEL